MEIKEKYSVLLIAVFWLLTAGTGMAGDQCAVPHAQIVCKSPSYDVGTVKGRKTVKHTFLIENTGVTPLEIKEVKACCGLKASCTTNRIDPQGTAEVAVSFPLLGRSGAQNKVIKVFSSDPHTPEYHLTMRGEVEAVVSADVRRIDFGLMKPGGTAVTNFTVRGVSPDSVFIAVSNSCFSVEQKAVESNWVTFCVKAASGPLPCVMNGTVSVRTQPDGDPVLTVPLTAVAGWDLMAFPDRIQIEPVQAWKTVNRLIFIQSRDQAPFKIIQTSIAGAEGQVGIQSIQPDKCRLAVKLTAVAGNPPPELRIDAEHNGQLLHLTVPVVFGKTAE